MDFKFNAILENCETLVVPTGAFVYFLFQNDDLVYIGKSVDLLSRVSSHRSSKEFNSIKYLQVSLADQADLEIALIKVLRPKYNIQKVSRHGPGDEIILKKYGLSETLFDIKIRKMPPPIEGDYGTVYIEHNGKLIKAYYDDDYFPARGPRRGLAIIYPYDERPSYWEVDRDALFISPDRDTEDAPPPTLTLEELRIAADFISKMNLLEA